MDAVLHFITHDMARKRLSRSSKLSLAAASLLLAVGIAFAWRDSFQGVFTWEYLAPAAAMLVPTALAVWFLLMPELGSSRRSRLVALCFGAVLGLTLLHPGAAADFQYANASSFWYETARCLGKGLVASCLASLLLTAVSLRLLPLPTSVSQLLTGVTASMTGILMLNLHCMSPDYGHIILGHWAFAVPLTLGTFYWQRLLVKRHLQRLLPTQGRGLKNLGAVP